MAITDEKIGANVLQLRRTRTQKDVADAMRQRGWKWSQATVWSVEKGDRPLRLTEATDLADILGVDVQLFFRWSPNDRFRLQYEELMSARDELRAAIASYRTRVVSGVLGAVSHDLSPEDESQLAQALLETPARVFAEYAESVEWPMGDVAEASTPAAEEKLATYNRWLVALESAWQSDAEAVAVAALRPGG